MCCKEFSIVDFRGCPGHNFLSMFQIIKSRQFSAVIYFIRKAFRMAGQAALA